MTDNFYDEPQEWENPKETMNKPPNRDHCTFCGYPKRGTGCVECHPKSTKPKLSAEMEIVTKFRQFLANWDYAHLTRKVSVEESRQMCDEFALTLATALEEQKQGYWKKVNCLPVEAIAPGIGNDWVKRTRVLAILNGKE